MVIYKKADPQEFPQVLDFINMVFSMDHNPHDFRQLLPKLYGEGQEEKSIHYLALEDQKIQACVCVLPITLCCGKEKITCATVGSVSVHPYSRGKGYMRNLMNLAIRDMKENHISMSSLSGRRNRYQYYGYEKGGFFFQYRFLADNFRHSRQKFFERNVSLCQIQDSKDPLISQIQTLQERNAVFAQRDSQDFLAIMESWNTKLYGILENNELTGYVALQGNQILELYLIKEDLIFSSLEACLTESNCDELYLRVPPYDHQILNGISQLYESFTLSLDDNYMIFDYSKVLEFFLKVKARYVSLDSGSLDVFINGPGKFRIQVENGIPSVTSLDDSSDENETLELSLFESISTLFSVNPSIVAKESGKLKKYNWFPLPLALSPLDKC